MTERKISIKIQLFNKIKTEYHFETYKNETQLKLKQSTCLSKKLLCLIKISVKIILIFVSHFIMSENISKQLNKKKA